MKNDFNTEMVSVEKEVVYHELGHFIAITSLLGNYVYNEKGEIVLPTVECLHFNFSFGYCSDCRTQFYQFHYEKYNGEISDIYTSAIIYAGEMSAYLNGYRPFLRLAYTDAEKVRYMDKKSRNKGKNLAREIIENNRGLINYLFSKLKACSKERNCVLLI